MIGHGGADEARANVERDAAALGVREAVRFAGVRTDMPRLLRTCDVYVNSSRYEGMSNTILEGMAAGRPVVATAVGGTPDLIGDGVTGFLVPAGEPEPMAGRVIELLIDPGMRERMGTAGRARMEAVHSLPAMVRAYASLYSELGARLKGRKRPAAPATRG